MKWRFMLHLNRPGDWNMAADEYLLRKLDSDPTPTLRIYTWDRPTLSIGYAQHASRHVNIAACRRHGVPVVRRITGGKAVLHDLELTYSVTGTADRYPFNDSILDTYRNFAQTFITMFQTLNIPAVIAPEKTTRTPESLSSCFAQPSSYEILVHNRKIMGSAQKRMHHRILQHGSLLMDYRHHMWQTLLVRVKDDDGRHVTSILRETGKHLELEMLAGALKQSFQSQFHAHFQEAEFDAQNLREIETLRKNYPDLASLEDTTKTTGS